MRRGFTLVEVLVTAALVLIFGAMAVATLSYGTSLWRSGHRRAYAYDTATAVFHQMRDDLAAAKGVFWNKDVDAYDTRVRFIVDTDANGRQRLRFVRAIPDATVSPRIRQAGDAVDNDGDGSADEELYNLRDDDNDGRIDEDLMPLEGMCEVAYLMGLGPNDRYTLYRAVRAPIGGPGSLFLDENIDGDGTPSGDSPAGLAEPLTENGLLHLELRLWSQYTTTWDAAAPYAPWHQAFVPEYCGPRFDWDGRGATDDVRDDVYPYAVMVALSVEPPGRLQLPSRLRLAGPLEDDTLVVLVRGTLPPYNVRWPYLLVRDSDEGDEWMRFERLETGNPTRFMLNEDDPLGARGVRGTTAVQHDPVGADGRSRDVLFGYTLSTVLHNPTGREYWGQ